MNRKPIVAIAGVIAASPQQGFAPFPCRGFGALAVAPAPSQVGFDSSPAEAAPLIARQRAP
eukprot:8201545-Pyramimonas_sp.AAC.1